MKITFVKKVFEDGSPCRKCADVQGRLEASGQLQHIDETLIADERDAASPGIQLAERLGVRRAPFFVVQDDGQEQVYTVYFKFAKEVLGGAGGSRKDEARDLYDDNPDLDFV